MTDRPTTYSEAMDALANAAYAAVRAADNEDGSPVEALRELAAEIDCLAVHGMTRAEADDARRLYEGLLFETQDKYERLRRAVARFLAKHPAAYPDDPLVEPLWDLVGDFTDADLREEDTTDD